MWDTVESGQPTPLARDALHRVRPRSPHLPAVQRHLRLHAAADAWFHLRPRGRPAS